MQSFDKCSRSPYPIPFIKYIFIFLLRIIIGICKLCRSEHGAALLTISPELQPPSAEPIAVREPETSLSSLQEQPGEVRFYFPILLDFLKGVGKQATLN